MDIQTILAVVGGAFLAFFGARFAGRADTKIEDHRRIAINLASWTRANGLGLVTQLLTNYAVGDYSGILTSVRHISDVLGNPEEAQNTIKNFLDVQLGKQLDTAEGRENLMQFIEKKLGVVIDRTAIATKPVKLAEVKS